MFTLTPSSFQKCLHHVKVGAVVTRTQLNTLQIQLQRFIRFSVLQPHGFGGTTGCQRGGVVAKDFYSIKWILNECSWWRFQDLPSSQPFCCSSVTSATHEKQLQEPRSQKWNLSFLSALAALPYSTLQKRQEESEVGAKQWQATLIALLYESMGWHQKWSDLQRPIAFCVPKFQTSKNPSPNWIPSQIQTAPCFQEQLQDLNPQHLEEKKTDSSCLTRTGPWSYPKPEVDTIPGLGLLCQDQTGKNLSREQSWKRVLPFFSLVSSWYVYLNQVLKRKNNEGLQSFQQILRCWQSTCFSGFWGSYLGIASEKSTFFYDAPR